MSHSASDAASEMHASTRMAVALNMPAALKMADVSDYAATVRHDFNDTDQHFLFVATAGMALSALLFLYYQMNTKEERGRLVFVIAFFCTAISCFSYFAMASGYGVFVIANGGLVFWARYVDWMITTPLSLVIMAILAQAKLEETFFLVVADLLMVVCWLCFALTAAPFKYVWWSVGTLLFLVVALRLHAVVQESEARVGTAAYDVLKTLAMITTAMWLGYPLMILLGADGVGAIPTKAELGCLTLLDLSAKAGAFIYLLFNVEVLSARASLSSQ